jgi:hypothetical protein
MDEKARRREGEKARRREGEKARRREGIARRFHLTPYEPLHSAFPATTKRMNVSCCCEPG